MYLDGIDRTGIKAGNVTSVSALVYIFINTITYYGLA
jgi:hypothetical protein